MVDHFDARGAKRTAYITPLQIKDLRSGEIHEAEMLDYSDSGISFASDGFLEKGTPIYFGILYPPHYFPTRVFEYYKGEVRRRMDLKRSTFKYGYGIQLASESGLQRASAKDAETNEEKRIRSRRSFFRPLRFGTENEIYSGNAKNISASGVFIAANEKLQVGQRITLNLPLKKGITVRTVGEIVWINEEGFGLKFTEIKNEKT
jgi:Tfp pilus assembly protein PilZ